MKISREKLIAALDKVSPGLASKEIIEQSHCFVFKNKKVYSFNDEVSVNAPLDIGVEGVVPSKQLLNLLSRSTDTEIELSIDADKLVVKGKKFSASIAISDDIKLPIDSVQIPDVWTDFPDDMLLKFELCQLSVGHDMAKPVLTCVHWKDKIVESCDNYRVSQFETKHDGPSEGILIPGNSLVSLTKNYKPTQYSYTAEWVHFKTVNDVIYSIRLFGGTYPDLSSIIMMSGGEDIVFPAELSDVLFRSEVMADSSSASPEAIISIKDKLVTVSSSSEQGSFNEQLDIASDIEIEFRVFSRLLQGILQHLESALIDVNSGKVRFTSSEGLVHILTVSKV